MTFISTVTPLILTFNEASNIRRTLAKLAWAKDVLVVDSFSTDETMEIAKSFPNVRIVQRQFDNHTAQWNFGVTLCKTEWVLALDADYVLSPAFSAELASLAPPKEVDAYFAKFRYCVFGQPLRATLYPPRAVLFRKDRCRYVQDGHTQNLYIKGQTAFLQNAIEHDDRKPLAHWFWAQDRYAVLETAKLLDTPMEKLSFQDKLRRKIIFAPVLVFLYALFGKGLISGGWAGWFYVFQRTLAEIILSLRLIEKKLERQRPGNSSLGN